MSIRRSTALIVLLVAASALTAFSQSKLKKDLTFWIDDAGSKLVQLAEAMPQEKFAWRPAEGVRSFSEVCMHAAMANYFFPSLVGVKSDVAITKETEKITDKAKVVAMLKSSLDQMREVINEMPDSSFEKATSIFGTEGTYQGVFLLAMSHIHEHLGQAIAYARMNGVTPPWSKPE